MIITISGKAGSGKSTIAREIAKKLHLKHYSTGDLMRQMAKERCISLLDFSKIAEKDKSIDKELDDRQIQLGKKEQDFVIDGRLSAFFIPHAEFRIFLKADDKVRAERIMRNNRKDEQQKDIVETIKSINKREESERKRYSVYYKIDYSDEKMYNIIIDTTHLTIQQAVNEIISQIKNRIG